jgi:hypothetical protein
MMSLRSLIFYCTIAAGVSHCPEPAVAGGLIGDFMSKLTPFKFNAGKSIDDAHRQISDGVPGSVPGAPEVAQSPTSLCKINPSLPQCEGTTGGSSAVVK